MRSIARWLMHAREQGGYPIRWFSHQRVAGIVSCKSGGADRLRQKCLSRVGANSV